MSPTVVPMINYRNLAEKLSHQGNPSSPVLKKMCPWGFRGKYYVYGDFPPPHPSTGNIVVF